MKTCLSLFTILLFVLAATADASSTAEPAVTEQTDVSRPQQKTPAASLPVSETDPTSDVTAADLLPAGDALPDTVGMVTRMGLSLIAVILLIWGAVQLLKKFSPGGMNGSTNSHVRVLDRVYIAPKKSIYVVQIGDKALALGVSDQQMTNLTDLDLEDTLARYQNAANTRVSQRFTDVLKTVNTRFSRQTEEPAT